jgi:ribonuclease D
LSACSWSVIRDVVANFLDSEAAAKLPVEARVLASLALEPKASASRVAKLLPQLDRAPNDEELLRLAQFPAEAGVGEALQALLTHEKSRAAVAETLLAQRTKLDAKQVAPLLTQTAKQMLQTSPMLASQLISGFQLTALEQGDFTVAMLKVGKNKPDLLRGLRDLRTVARPSSW